MSRKTKSPPSPTAPPRPLTDAQVDALVDDMRAVQGIHPHPKWNRGTDAYWDETYRIRDAMTSEFGRRMGWEDTDVGFTADDLGGLPKAERRMKYKLRGYDYKTGNWITGHWFDVEHTRYYRVGGEPAAIACQPYGTEESWANLVEHGNEMGGPQGLVCFRSEFPSWWAPNEIGHPERAYDTALIVLAKKCFMPKRYSPFLEKPERDAVLQAKLEEETRLFVQKKRDARKVTEHRRRARFLSAPGSFTKSDINAIRANQDGLCAACDADLKKTGEHIDHILALALGGSNWPHNLQILCPSCNLSKSAKHWLDWNPPNLLKKLKCV